MQVTAKGLTRGDRRYNEKLGRLREAVRPDHNAILAIDLADAKQAAVVTGFGHQILARRLFCTSPWGLSQAIDWALEVAERAGLEGLTVACEPTGHRWKPLAELCRRRGLTLVCVPTLLVHRGREEEDLTRDRSDRRDATLIARRVRDLRCYLVVVPGAAWARLRHLGKRRDQALEARTAARQQLRDLLACYWPGALEAAGGGLRSLTLRACLGVSADPEVVGAMAYEDFARAVGVALRALRGERRCLRVVRAYWEAARDHRQIPWEREGAAERASFCLADLCYWEGQVAEAEDRLVALADALGLLTSALTIPGLSAVGAAAIFAETGDPRRYGTGRAWAKHAGICPRDNDSGTSQGKTTVSGRGRPLLRTAAWRAIWGLLPNNPVFAARYRHLTTRAHNPLQATQARTALAAGLLRQLWAVTVGQVPWDPEVASGGKEVAQAA